MTMLALPVSLSTLRKGGGISQRLLLFWACFSLAVVSFGVSLVLFVASATPKVRFVCALISLASTAAIQRYTLLEAVVRLSHRENQLIAVLLEATFR